MSNPDRIVHRYIARGAAVVTEYRDGTNGRKDRYPSAAAAQAARRERNQLLNELEGVKGKTRKAWGETA